ncbi:MAG: hypothetical protein AAF850_13170 [Pseudomonadota bacterium]
MLHELDIILSETSVGKYADRRLNRRLLAAWSRAASGRYPSWREIQQEPLGADWDWIFVVDLKRSVGFPYFIFLGERLAKLSDVFLRDGTDWSLTLLDLATREIDAGAQLGPNMTENEVFLCDGRRVIFRAVTAPLADDGEHVTHVLGAANGRFAPLLKN